MNATEQQGNRAAPLGLDSNADPPVTNVGQDDIESRFTSRVRSAARHLDLSKGE